MRSLLATRQQSEDETHAGTLSDRPRLGGDAFRPSPLGLFMHLSDCPRLGGDAFRPSPLGLFMHVSQFLRACHFKFYHAYPNHRPICKECRSAKRLGVLCVIHAALQRMARCWICAIVSLLLGMGAVLVWSQFIYDDHYDDPCDQPLALMLRLMMVIVIVQILRRDIVRNCLCYDMARDGPVPPVRVQVLKWTSILAAVAWPVAAGIMLLESRDCSPQLKKGIAVILAYYAAVAIVLVIAPGLLITVMLCLVRRGL
ncbi:unnamed protein product, partial [Polarella glacialis]